MVFVEVSPNNIMQETLFCIKDTNSPGFKSKESWFKEQYKSGLKLKILKDTSGKQIAFIEYKPIEQAWRPVQGEGFMFIHCMFVYSNKDKNKGIGSILIKECEKDARSEDMKGVCTMTSKGTWMTDKRLFKKNGYIQTDSIGRFELMIKKFDKNAKEPYLIDWTSEAKKYKGWNLVYSDQCPWHQKAVTALSETANESGIDLNIKKLNGN